MHGVVMSDEAVPSGAMSHGYASLVTCHNAIHRQGLLVLRGVALPPPREALRLVLKQNYANYAVRLRSRFIVLI